MAFCTKCGVALSPDDLYCDACGASVKNKRTGFADISSAGGMQPGFTEYAPQEMFPAVPQNMPEQPEADPFNIQSRPASGKVNPAALVWSIINIVLSFLTLFSIVPGIFGLVFALKAGGADDYDKETKYITKARLANITGAVFVSVFAILTVVLVYMTMLPSISA